MKRFGKWNWHDIWRFPVVLLVLGPLTHWNFVLRQLGYLPDQWFWADVKMMEWGY